jgi:hypothetical protein
MPESIYRLLFPAALASAHLCRAAAAILALTARLTFLFFLAGKALALRHATKKTGRKREFARDEFILQPREAGISALANIF